jgi:pimeloyl-ACP methyl ester carboxylesterase
MQSTPVTGTLDIGRGAPVLALHSSTSSKSQWRPLAAQIGSRHRVVAVDLHGYGSNPMPPADRPFRLEDEVDLVVSRAAAVLGSQEPVHVVGHSYGAAVALSLAVLRPDLVRSLSLFEPVCFNLLERDGPYYNLARLFADRVEVRVDRGELSDAARFFTDHWGGPGSYDAFDAEARKRLDRTVPKVPLDFQALFTAPDADWYAAIKVPTLLMAGTNSLESARTMAKVLWATIPASRLVVLPGDHLLPTRNPVVANNEIAKFLRDLGFAGQRPALTSTMPSTTSTMPQSSSRVTGSRNSRRETA